ncbi:MAG: hypothetical protein HY735_36175 [Verrucomicrobia bacterium]|nr:hypothetical protein [Verrucomicrobiota bacterium]
MNDLRFACRQPTEGIDGLVDDWIGGFPPLIDQSNNPQIHLSTNPIIR